MSLKVQVAHHQQCQGSPGAKSSGVFFSAVSGLASLGYRGFSRASGTSTLLVLDDYTNRHFTSFQASSPVIEESRALIPGPSQRSRRRSSKTSRSEETIASKI